MSLILSPGDLEMCIRFTSSPFFDKMNKILESFCKICFSASEIPWNLLSIGGDSWEDMCLRCTAELWNLVVPQAPAIFKKITSDLNMFKVFSTVLNYTVSTLLFFRTRYTVHKWVINSEDYKDYFNLIRKDNLCIFHRMRNSFKETQQIPYQTSKKKSFQ